MYFMYELERSLVDHAYNAVLQYLPNRVEAFCREAPLPSLSRRHLDRVPI